MDLCQKLMALLFTMLVSPALFADEIIHPHDSFHSEKGYRAIVEKEFPELEFGFYFWDGEWLIGALEDFDRDRILLFLPGGQGGQGVARFSKNGDAIPLPTGKPVTVKVAGGIITHEGIFDDPENSHETTIGYWVDLEATDTLSMSYKLTWPFLGEFKASYDPDGKWKVSLDRKEEKKAPKKRADAYEISRRSLVKQVKDVLAKQEKCLIRFEDGLEMIAISAPKDKRNYSKVRLKISDRVVAKYESGVQEELLPAEVPRHLELARSAANVAGIRIRLLLEISPKTDDRIFRSTLKAAAGELYQEVEIRQVEAARKK